MNRRRSSSPRGSARSSTVTPPTRGDRGDGVLVGSRPPLRHRRAVLNVSISPGQEEGACTPLNSYSTRRVDGVRAYVYPAGTRLRRAANLHESPKRQFPRQESRGTAQTHHTGAASKTTPTTQRGIDGFFSSRHFGSEGVSQYINVHPRPFAPTEHVLHPSK